MLAVAVGFAAGGGFPLASRATGVSMGLAGFACFEEALDGGGFCPCRWGERAAASLVFGLWPGRG